MNRPIDAAPGVGGVPADGPKDKKDVKTPLAHLIELTDSMLAYRPNNGVNWAHFRFSSVNPRKQLEEIERSRYRGLLVHVRSPMPFIEDDSTIRLASPSNLTGVRLEAHKFKGPRRNHSHRRLDLILDYQYQEPKYSTRALQRLSLSGDPQDGGRLELYRVALVDLNSHRAGYDRKDLENVTDEVARDFMNHAGNLFNTWKVENPIRVAIVTGSQSQAPASTTS